MSDSHQQPIPASMPRWQWEVIALIEEHEGASQRIARWRARGMPFASDDAPPPSFRTSHTPVRKGERAALLAAFLASGAISALLGTAVAIIVIVLLEGLR